jgi:multidrug efflux pump subunit AcrA (membrane-fusion protein)
VQVTLSAAVPEVLPGMAASVRFSFPSPEQTPRFVVPSTAIGEDRQGRFAFTVDEQPGGALVARRRAVTIGQLGSDGLEVTTGLSAGDRLITAGTAYLTDGMMVRLVEGTGR